jgi:hypothetical protein
VRAEMAINSATILSSLIISSLDVLGKVKAPMN